MILVSKTIIKNCLKNYNQIIVSKILIKNSSNISKSAVNIA